MIFNRVIHSKLLRDNLILFVGSFSAGILGFLYHFHMGRTLGPSLYGVLGTILSAFYMVNIAFTGTIQTALTRFTVQYTAEHAPEKVTYLIFQSLKKLAFYGLILYAMFVLFVPFLSTFLFIEPRVLYISGTLLFFTLFVPVGRGVLQGTQRFLALSLNSLGEGIVKLLLGVVLVAFGYGILGAIGAIILSYAFALFLLTFPLKQYFHHFPTKIVSDEIYRYSFPLLIMLISLTSFFSLDVVLVKHFFDPIQAGYYSALSLLGKIIFFGSVSISQVMFPKTAELADRGGNHQSLFLKSFLLVLGSLVVALAVYFVFPKLIVSLLFGEQFFDIIPYVGLFGVFIAIYSLVYVVSFYYMSLKKTKFILLLVAGNILQIVLIWMNHDSLVGIITRIIFLMTFLLILLVMPLFSSLKHSAVRNV